VVNKSHGTFEIRKKMSPGFAKLKGGLFSSYHALGDAGVTLMGWADPFYPDPSIPPHVLEATIASIKTGFPSHYTMPIGDLELRREIAKKVKRVNGLDVVAEKNVVVTPGSDTGLYYAMVPFMTPGDEVMVTDPSYPSNFSNPELMGGVTVRVPVREEDGYQFDVEEFRKRLTPKTKMVLLTHPNNPTTTVFRREKLEQLASFIIENDLVLVCDQAFENTIFDGVEFVTPASLPGMWERTVSVFSTSKGLGLSGFRVAYIVASDEIMDVLYGGAVNILGATNTAAQQGAIAAFRDASFMDEYNKIHERRRKIAFDTFNSIPKVSMLMPESGFYSWVNVSKLGKSSEVVDYLIRHARVAVNDGSNYGPNGEGYIRVIHGSLRDETQVVDALGRMKSALRRLAAEKGLER